jgi:hypothetical protein
LKYKRWTEKRDEARKGIIRKRAMDLVSCGTGKWFCGVQAFRDNSSTKRAEQSNYMEDEYTSNKSGKVKGVLSFLRKGDMERRTVN